MNHFAFVQGGSAGRLRQEPVCEWFLHPMCPDVYFDVPPGDFAACEAQLREAGLQPEVRERKTVDFSAIGHPPQEQVTGTISWQGKSYDFEWRSDATKTELVVTWMMHDAVTNGALFDELDRLFPEPSPLPLFSAADLEPVEELPEPWWRHVLCAVRNILLALVVYRVFVWLRSS